jgi:transcriptional regulator with XRE-family HTH domain
MYTMVNDFRKWVIEELEKRSWSQAELARRMGITRAGVNMLLNESRNPSLDTYEK